VIVHLSLEIDTDGQPAHAVVEAVCVAVREANMRVNSCAFHEAVFVEEEGNGHSHHHPETT
jgi:hypothetical protein